MKDIISGLRIQDKKSRGIFWIDTAGCISVGEYEDFVIKNLKRKIKNDRRWNLIDINGPHNKSPTNEFVLWTFLAVFLYYKHNKIIVLFKLLFLIQ